MIHRASINKSDIRTLLDWSRATVNPQSIHTKRRGEYGTKPHWSKQKRLQALLPWTTKDGHQPARSP